MRQLGIVFRFEFIGYLQKKSFRLLTIALVVVIAVVLSWPRISGLFGSDEGGSAPAAGTVQTVALVDGQQAPPEDLVTYYNAAFAAAGVQFVPAAGTPEELEAQVDTGVYDAAVILTGPLGYTHIASNVGMYDTFDSIFSEAMLARYQADTLSALGVPGDEIASFVAAGVQSTIITTESGKDQMQNFLYTYILVFLLYFAIIMYGNFVASSVGTEKTTRAMELLITATKPTNLMFGKVLGAGLAGLSQLVVILGSAYLFYNLNAAYYAQNIMVQSIFAMPLSMLLYTILFFVLGFFIYAFLFAAMASLISRLEDLSIAVLPVTYLFIAAFMVVMISMGSGNVDNPVMVVCSFVPLTSPMAMFTRIAMGSVPGWQIAVSVAILVASTVGIGMLAAAIYRMGVLLYGKPPKVKELFRMLRAERRQK